MIRKNWTAIWALLAVLAFANSSRGEVTAAQVKEAIETGCKFLEKQQNPDGNWPEYEGEPGGLTALCTLALLNSGRTKGDPTVAKALAYLERKSNPGRTYSASLMIMAFAQADPKAYKLSITRLANWLEAHQIRDNDTKGGWTYSERGGRADNSNSQFALLGLHEAERVGVKVSDQTWQLALQYWTKAGMQNSDGGFGYDVGHPSTGSMTSAGIASLIIIRDRLHSGDAAIVDGRVQCCGNQERDEPLEEALAWMGNHFSVQRNPNSPQWYMYYLYALERAGRMSGQRYFVSERFVDGKRVPEPHDWYREGCEVLIEAQKATFNNSWQGQGFIENNQIVATSLALLFLSKGRRPVVMAKVKHQSDALGASSDWDHHRRSTQNLTMAVEKAWARDLSWQTIDVASADITDLLEAPVLFLSGADGLDLTPEQKKNLKQYVEQGGFIFAEACNGNGCDGAQFDADFRALMRELFPDSELRKLPPDHAVWYAEKPVNPQHLPDDPEFWLWGLDACCRTSVIYCPRSLSCYWELAHPYREAVYAAEKQSEINAVVTIGVNVVSYATGRELKEKLDRPQITISSAGGKSPRGALVVPKLSHGGGSDDAPSALNNLLTVMEKQLEMRVDYEKRLITPADVKLLDYPVVFMHGRRSFKFSAAERKALKDYLDRGGFLFADAICANKEFADSLRAELKAIYPELDFARIPPSHPLFTAEFHGFDLPSVELRDPQIRAEGDPLTARIVKTTPLLEGLEIDGRIAVVLSPNDISCALEKGAALECKSYTPPDAARLGANVLLYALQQ